MEEYKTDMQMAIESLEDEMNGIEEYKYMIAKTKDQEFHKMLSDILAVEKQHATMLLNWINQKAPYMLK